MALTDRQIERYSRQIIVPGIGGNAQERLLASRLAIIGEADDAAAPLAYFAGAGVGTIFVYPVGDPRAYTQMIESVRDLNPDVTAGLGSHRASQPAASLMLALIGNRRAAEAAIELFLTNRFGKAVVARLDLPGRIAVLPSPPPCPLCMDAMLFESVGESASNASAVAMVAVTEAFKLAAGSAATAGPQVIEFTGYTTSLRTSGRRGDGARCVCEA